MLRRHPLVALVLGLAFLAALFGYASARQTPRVVRYTVLLPDWPAGQPPLRIVQLSDIHGSRIDMPPARIAAIVAQVNARHPDMIVLTGDYCCGKYLDNTLLPLADIVTPLARLHAPLGVFAVVGNHDTKAQTARAFGPAGIRLLVNDWVDTGPVVLAGVDDATNSRNPAIALQLLSMRLPPGRPVILIAHEPDYFAYMPRVIGMLIAGHTHGGQIMLPVFGTRSLGPFLDAHLRGQFAEHGQQMIVSSGLGTSIVPLRWSVPPEIVEITVGGQASGRKSGTDR